MAPSFGTGNTYIDTGSRFMHVEATQTTITIRYTQSPRIPKETKKEKIARIAKEKMKASHVVYNENMPKFKTVYSRPNPCHNIRGLR